VLAAVLDRPRFLAGLCFLAVLVDGGRYLALEREKREYAARAAAQAAARVEAAQRRLDHILDVLTGLASRAATLPDAGAALASDRAAISRLFGSLEQLRRSAGRDAPALALHTLTPATIAWAGPLSDIRLIAGSGFDRVREVPVLGSVSTSLIVTSPVRNPSGTLIGVATAELAVAVHRNIRNGFLRDFDLLQGGDRGLEVRYLDPQEAVPPGPGRTLGSRSGTPIALVTASPPGLEEASRAAGRPFEKVLVVLVLLALLAWASPPGQRARWAAAAVVARLVLLALGPPFVPPASPILSPAVYSSALLVPPALGHGVLGDALGALLGSPLDFFLTTGLLLFLALLGAARAVGLPEAKPSLPRAAIGDLLCLAVLWATFTLLADTQANATLDTEAISLIPKSLAQCLLQLGLLFTLGAGVSILVAIQLRTALGSGRLLAMRLLLWIGLGAALASVRPSALAEIPIPMAVLAALLSISLGNFPDRLARWLRQSTPGGRAGAALVGTAVVASLLYPSLLMDEQRAGRAQIENDYAPKVLHQPQWRQWVLTETEQQIDALAVLKGALPSPRTADLAFAVWSRTELAAVGCSSAIEIQDAAGLVVSRFALNLPTLEAPWKMLPEAPEWSERKEPFSLASAERLVLHGERLLGDGTEARGGIQVYVGDDFWNLPFVTARDPYFELYRPSSGAGSREHNLGLVAWDPSRSVIFSSVEHAPSPDPELLQRLASLPPGQGFWTTLLVEQDPSTAYLFQDPRGNVYALFYPERSLGRLAADLVEAVSGLTLATLAGLLLLMLLRTLLGRDSLTFPALIGAVQGRFALRLFVAFLVIAVAPVGFLEGVVRGFVARRLDQESNDQAMERATFARKTVEDAFWFQRDESTGGKSVTDAALVWISTLVKGDLDLFQGGELLASSKRELYSSGLLSPWVPGSVYRSIALEGQASVLRTDTIGTFRYLVVSVPVRTRAGSEPWILSIPLALRQREMASVLEDLDRTIRLGLVLFLGAAAAVAHSMSRRISDPISALTRATRQVAEGDLEARVLPTSKDELSHLVESFNQMASDLERQRTDLEHSNRLAAWAEMARQVAHEVKNPLTPIQLSAEHLRRVYGDPSVDFRATLHSCTETILRQVRNLRGIVTEFSAYARPPASELGPVDLEPLLRASCERYMEALPPGIGVTLETQPAPPVRADARLLERAIVNLLENALQAVGEVGTIRVRLRHAREEARVVVEVEDSGPGIEPEVLGRVFEPFFSTKTSGSGLGLALVKKTVEDHGGGVSLVTRPGSTRVSIWLPVAPEAS
jgi:signal transduction histidine kinase